MARASQGSWRNPLVEDPGSADLILFADLHMHDGRDVWARAVLDHPLRQQFPSKSRVYDERDQPLFSLPGAYAGARRSMARLRPIIGAAYPPWLTTLESNAEVEPDLLFSFVGSRTHPVRDAVLELRHDDAIVAATFTGENARTHFSQTLTRSRFVLCPRGQSPSSFRLYEAMSAGRVPVVISDDWLPPPGLTEAGVIVRVRERQVRELPTLLEELRPGWRARGDKARMFYESNFAAHSWWDSLIDGLVGLSTQRLRPPRALQSYGARLSLRAARARWL